jgi:hypothetical protein
VPDVIRDGAGPILATVPGNQKVAPVGPVISAVIADAVRIEQQ